MKEYKLIKKYPGLPKDWEVGMIVGTGDRQGQACFSPCSGKYTDKHIDHNDVINNPEFWEEIKKECEKEYEILSFYAKNIGGKDEVNPHYIWYETRKGSNLWSRMQNITSPYTTGEILKNKNYAIHSVRRLSDGEVFTVGDVCEFGKITKIFITEGGCCMTALPTSDTFYNCNIMYLKKTKPVLFTTEDGVDIREGDDYYYIVNTKVYKSQATNTDYTNFYTLQFSTREKAEEYILLNKPCLSITDIQSIYVSAKKGYKKNGNETNYFEELINLVKARL